MAQIIRAQVLSDITRFNIFEVDEEGQTGLHHAALTNDHLLFHKVVNLVGKWLHESQTIRSVTNIPNPEALSKKVSPETSDELMNWPTKTFWSTPLHYAVTYLSSLSIETLDLFLACGKSLEQECCEALCVNVNAKDKYGYTALLWALHKRQSIELVKHLVSLGADWSVRSNFSYNALHKCAELGLLEHLNYFVDLGCNVNELDNDGDNALHYAILYYSASTKILIEMIKVLIRAGVDKTSKNLEGKTAHDIAVEKDRPRDVLNLLK